MNKSKGITLIVLIITVILLLILSGLVVTTITRRDNIIDSAQESNFSIKIRQYQQQIDKYVARQNVITSKPVNITTSDKQEIKNIIQDITDEDLEKYVIQNNELRYDPEAVTNQEKTWLEKLGILVMETLTLFTITYIVNGNVYQTVKSDTIVFPEEIPTTINGTFNGWYYEEEGINQAQEGDVITQNTTLYAGWSKILYSTFTLGSGGDYGDGLAYSYNENGPNGMNGYYGTEGLWYGYLESSYIRKIMMKYKSGAEKYELLSCTGDFLEYSPYLDENGNLAFQEDFPAQHFNASFSIKVTYSDMGVTIYQVNFENAYIYCLAEGTKITLSDHKTKNIENITYEDRLLVWDFDNGCFAEAKPLWIKKAQVAEEYNLVKFDNGVELKTVADHRIFNMESQKFTYTMNEEDTPIGTTTFMEDGTTAKLIERKVVRKKVNYYNVITDYHMNLFANGILTSLRLNNLYKIENMKFIKDDRKLAEKTEFIGIPDKYFYGLRLAEQPKEINQGNDVKHTNTLKEYVERILKLAK